MGRLKQQRGQCWLPGKSKVPHRLDWRGRGCYLLLLVTVTLPRSRIELQIDWICSSALEMLWNSLSWLPGDKISLWYFWQIQYYTMARLQHASSIPMVLFSCSHPRSMYRQEWLPRAEMLRKELPFLHLSAPIVLLEFHHRRSGCHELAPCHDYTAVNVIALVHGKIH